MKKDIIKNPLRLAIKLFIITWVLLILQIVLKVTFNYWQPYVIPTEQLEMLSNFIDKTFIKDILDFLLYVVNGTFMMLASIVRWWFKDKKQSYIFFGTCVVLGILNLHPILCNFTPIISCFVLPLDVMIDMTMQNMIIWVILSTCRNPVIITTVETMNTMDNLCTLQHME